MRNLIRFLGIIALVAVIGFSFVACGDAEQGPMGPQGDKGDTGQQGNKGDTGPEGPMRPDILLSYIPEESGLWGTTWKSAGGTTVIFSNDGLSYTSSYNQNTVTHQILSYGKRLDGTPSIISTDGSIVVNDNTFTLVRFSNGDRFTYTEQQ
jgi:hypothetical protein